MHIFYKLLTHLVEWYHTVYKVTHIFIVKLGEIFTHRATSFGRTIFLIFLQYNLHRVNFFHFIEIEFSYVGVS